MHVLEGLPSKYEVLTSNPSSGGEKITNYKPGIGIKNYLKISALI
jgi:hypothetical protein